MKKDDVAYAVSARIVRRGMVKIAEVSITDGVDTWTFDTAESFTVNELRRRFPFFNKPKVDRVRRKRKNKDTIPVLPGQTNIMEALEDENGKRT